MYRLFFVKRLWLPRKALYKHVFFFFFFLFYYYHYHYIEPSLLASRTVDAAFGDTLHMLILLSIYRRCIHRVVHVRVQNDSYVMPFDLMVPSVACDILVGSCFLHPISASVQLRCLGATTPPSSPTVRWWTSPAKSSLSMSATHLRAARGWSRTTSSETLSRKRPMRQLGVFRVSPVHRWTPFPTMPCRMRRCQFRKWWNGEH